MNNSHAIEAAACQLLDDCEVTEALPLSLTPLADLSKRNIAACSGLLSPNKTRLSASRWLCDLARRCIWKSWMSCLLTAAAALVLVRKICDWAATQGLAAVTLTTFRDVPWNAPFYARVGFCELSPEALTSALCERVAEEAARGLPSALRVVMQFDLKPV